MPDFTKVVAVGHSMGSIVTSGLLTQHPNAVDGCVLTEFLLSSEILRDNTDAHGLEFAPADKQERFHDYPNGYLVQTTVNDVQQLFFRGDIEPEAVVYADSVKDTTTVWEIVGVPFIIAVPATEYTRPLFVSYDIPPCHALADLSVCEQGIRFRSLRGQLHGHVQCGDDETGSISERDEFAVIHSAKQWSWIGIAHQCDGILSNHFELSS